MSKRRNYKYRMWDQIRHGFSEVTIGGEVQIDKAAIITTANPKHVDASELCEAFWSTVDEDTWQLGNPSFGPMRAPYPEMWIEGEMPDVLTAKDMDGNYKSARSMFERTAARVFEIPSDGELPAFLDTPGIRGLRQKSDFLIHADLLVQARGDSDVGFMGSLVVAVTASGEYVDDAVVSPFPESARGKVTAQMEEVYYQVVYQMIRPLMRAMALMNCKNLDVIESPELPQRSRFITPARGKPTTVYKTVKLPASAYESKPGKGGARDVRLHTVRGHFKTYTEDAPLMGKFVGTYWWSHSARGSKKRGKVIKDYEVKA